MSIGATIKKLRRERDITQEQLAEYMNISAPAISQWECDRSAPDISQLPLLANIFNVTTDFLLGVDISNKEKAIEKIIKDAFSFGDKGYYSEAEKILRAGLRKYPMSHKLMYFLMHAISNYPYDGEEFVQDKSDALNNEIITLGEKILAENNDDSLRRSAIQLLCYNYPKVNKTEEAIKLAKTMPSLYNTCDSLLSRIYLGDKRYRQFQVNIRDYYRNLIWDMQNINAYLDNDTLPYTPSQMLEIYRKTIAISEILFEDGKFYFYEQNIAWTYLRMANICADLYDRDSTIPNLRLSAKHAITYDTTEVSSDTIYTSLIFRGLKEYDTVSCNTAENDSLHQLNIMSGTRYDFIRNDAEFIEIETELKKYAKKL